MTWGRAYFGGDSSRVPNQLQNVQQICGAGSAFAAILADGRVVTWGDPRGGGDSSRVQNQLRNVRKICSTHHAFGAILTDGRVVTWGDPKRGGDSFRVRNQLFCCDFDRRKRGDLGRSKAGRGQLQSPRSSAERSTDLWHIRCFCRGFGRRTRGDLGRSTVVVIAPESKISCKMFNRFVAHLVLLLRFWQTDAW